MSEFEYQGYVPILRKKIKENLPYLKDMENRLPDFLEDFVQTHGTSLNKISTSLTPEQFENFIKDLDFNIKLQTYEHNYRIQIRKAVKLLDMTCKIEKNLHGINEEDSKKSTRQFKKYRLRFIHDEYYNIDLTPKNEESYFYAENKYDLLLQADEYVYQNSGFYYSDSNIEKKRLYKYLLNSNFMCECKEDFETEDNLNRHGELALLDNNNEVERIFPNTFLGHIDYMIYQYFQSENSNKLWFEEITIEDESTK